MRELGTLIKASRMVSRKCSSGEATRRAMEMGSSIFTTETQRHRENRKRKTLESTEETEATEKNMALGSSVSPCLCGEICTHGRQTPCSGSQPALSMGR